MRPLFPTGVQMITPGALEALESAGVKPANLITRHVSGDFGDLCPEDIEENLKAIEKGWRVFSAYQIGKERVWVITEATRDLTTILLASEY